VRQPPHLALNQCADKRIPDRWSSASSRTPVRFILLSSGRWSAPRRSCAILRQIAIRQSQAKRPGSRLRADSLQSLCRQIRSIARASCSPIDRGKDAGAAAAVPVVRRSDAGPIWYCPVLWRADERAHGDIDANDPKPTSATQRSSWRGLRPTPYEPRPQPQSLCPSLGSRSSPNAPATDRTLQQLPLTGAREDAKLSSVPFGVVSLVV
jgi:hypothetical protein